MTLRFCYSDRSSPVRSAVYYYPSIFVYRIATLAYDTTNKTDYNTTAAITKLTYE